VRGGAVATVDGRAVCGGQIRRVDEVLDSHRQTAERRAVAQAVDAAGLTQRALRVEHLPGLHHRLALGDPLQAIVHELLGGDLAPGEPLQRPGDSNRASHHPAAPTTSSSSAVALTMSESRIPTPFEQFPPARPPLGPRAPTLRARRTFWVLFAVAVALTVYVVWPFRAPLFLAAVLAAAFQPLLARTERLLKGRRKLAGALITLLVFGAIVAPIASILAFVATE